MSEKGGEQSAAAAALVQAAHSTCTEVQQMQQDLDARVRGCRMARTPALLLCC